MVRVPATKTSIYSLCKNNVSNRTFASRSRIGCSETAYIITSKIDGAYILPSETAPRTRCHCQCAQPRRRPHPHPRHPDPQPDQPARSGRDQGITVHTQASGHRVPHSKASCKAWPWAWCGGRLGLGPVGPLTAPMRQPLQSRATLGPYRWPLWLCAVCVVRP